MVALLMSKKFYLYESTTDEAEAQRILRPERAACPPNHRPGRDEQRRGEITTHVC